MSVLKSKKVTGSILGNSKKSGSLKREKVVNFEFIFKNNIPAGKYESTIEKLKEVTTKRGFPAVEVCYELKSLGGTSSQTYKVKQVYPEGTEYYDDFVKAMVDAINASDDQEISFDDLIGVTEKVTVMYPNNGNWGTFTDRKPLEKATTEVSEISNNQIQSLLSDYDEDDEFDDFLPEDDE